MPEWERIGSTGRPGQSRGGMTTAGGLLYFGVPDETPEVASSVYRFDGTTLTRDWALPTGEGPISMLTYGDLPYVAAEHLRPDNGQIFRRDGPDDWTKILDMGGDGNAPISPCVFQSRIYNMAGEKLYASEGDRFSEVDINLGMSSRLNVLKGLNGHLWIACSEGDKYEGHIALLRCDLESKTVTKFTPPSPYTFPWRVRRFRNKLFFVVRRPLGESPGPAVWIVDDDGRVNQVFGQRQLDGMIYFEDQLWICAMNTQEVGAVWRTSDGNSWELVRASENWFPRSFGIYNGDLYLISSWTSLGTGGAVELWRYPGVGTDDGHGDEGDEEGTTTPPDPYPPGYVLEEDPVFVALKGRVESLEALAAQLTASVTTVSTAISGLQGDAKTLAGAAAKTVAKLISAEVFTFQDAKEALSHSPTEYPPIPVPTGTQWVALGSSASGAGISQLNGQVSGVSLAFDSSKLPHLVWAGKTSGKWHVYYSRWNGSAWSGYSGSSEGEGLSGQLGFFSGSEPFLVLGSGDKPHIVWRGRLRSRSSERPVCYTYWNGSAWTGLAGSEAGLTTSDDCANPQLRLDSLARPHVAWASLAGTGIRYQYWDGSSWLMLGSSALARGVSSFLLGGASRPSLALDTQDRPHLAFDGRVSGTALQSVYYVYWTGSSWASLGSDAYIGGVSGQVQSAGVARLALTSAGVPYVAYQATMAAPDLGNVYLKYWTGSSWAGLANSDAGTGLSATSYGAGGSVLVIDANGRPHVAYYGRLGVVTDADGDKCRIFYKLWDSASWKTLGSGMFGSVMRTTIYTPALALDPLSQPGVAWLETLVDGTEEVYFERWV